MASGAGENGGNLQGGALEGSVQLPSLNIAQPMDTTSELEEEEVYGKWVFHPESETPSESGTEGLTWISWFCSLAGHQYFAEVAEEYIEDDFNLTGLNFLVPFYKEALEMILDIEPQEDSLKIPDVSIVESSAELLYGLIHQRYILTRQGMQQMVRASPINNQVDKYEEGHFGVCPRVFCNSELVLPCGRSDLPGLDTVKLFCPNCLDTYIPPSSRFHGIDGTWEQLTSGAFFGTTFPHMLLQCYRDLAPSIVANPSTSITPDDADGPPTERPSDTASYGALTPARLGREPPQLGIYVPRIYGFRVSEFAPSGSRMQWMRGRPNSLLELMQT